MRDKTILIFCLSLLLWNSICLVNAIRFQMPMIGLDLIGLIIPAFVLGMRSGRYLTMRQGENFIKESDISR